MNREKQRIAIAEACGWRHFQDSVYSPFGSPYLVGKPPDPEAQNLQKVPDYLNDLNAMNEAVESLDRFDKSLYHSALQRVVGIANTSNDEPRYATEATAAQRAEAFLRTLDLWEE